MALFFVIALGGSVLSLTTVPVDSKDYGTRGAARRDDASGPQASNPPRSNAYATAAAMFFAGPTSFTNSSSITFPSSGCPTGCQFATTNVVSGMAGTVSKVTVTLNNLSHEFVDDLDFMLVGPGGGSQNIVFMSDAGGGVGFNNTNPSPSVNLTFDDAAANSLPDNQPPNITTGSWKPTNFTSGTEPGGAADSFVSPAPASNQANTTFTAAFNGISPNGTWTLYAVDDRSTAGGTLAGGWTLTITTATAVATTTTVTSSANPSTTGNAVTFSATVKDASNNPVTSGSVTFKDGATNLTCTEGAQPRPVNGSGVATCTTSALTEGSHTINADYGGNASFNPSTGQMTQVVNNPTVVTGNQFCNGGAITIPNSGNATPYPSNIFVSGLTGSITSVTVQLNGYSHALPDDVDVLLVSPAGNIILMSDAGGGTAVSNVNLTFDDAAANSLPDNQPPNITTGSYKPTNFGTGDTFPAPAPAPSANTTLNSAFNGTSPNGTWSLYVVDDGAGSAGSIANGWCLNFTTSNDPATTTTISGSPNPSTTGQNVTFTATVVKTSDSTPATSGTVTFKEGSTNLTCNEGAQPRPVNASGQATCTTSALPEGSHTITAQYNGSPGQFNTSTGSTTQVVNNATVVTGTQFCNGGAITMPSAGNATPYPSNIFVSGLAGTVANVTVNLNGLTHTFPDNVDVLLVGPGGQNIVLLSDAGDTQAISNVNLTFDDAAASQLPDEALITAGTYKPSNYAPADTFPAPAPAPSANTTLASSFGGINPNGTWSLYVVDDTSGDVGSISGGWCLNFTLNNPSNVSISDASLAEPSSGSANMVFTVFTSPAPTTSLNVTFTTEPDPVGANPATAGSDYTPTSGTLTFAPGQSVQTISVPILSDGLSEPPETFIVHLTGLTGGSPGSAITDDKATGTITDPGTAPVASLLISELRTSGPSSVDNDFVEIYNNSDSQFTIPAGGYGLFKMGATCTDTPVLIGTIPAGTVIPARGHYLFVGSAYSLAAYAAGNQTLTSNIENDRNVGLFSTVNLANLSAATRLDSVGFGTNGTNNCDLLSEGSRVANTSGSASEYSVVRRMETGFDGDTNNNAADFYVVSTTPTVAVGSTAAPRLGAPGPENLASPVLKYNSQIQSVLIDPTKAAEVAPNRTRDTAPYTDTLTPSAPNGGAPASNPYSLGTLSVHRRFINQTGAPVTRLRFRVVDITTFNSPNVTPVGAQADIRLLSSNGVTRAPAVPAGVNLKGLTLEQPPTQPSGGGWNSTVSAGTITLANPLPATDNAGTPQMDNAIDVQFLIGVATSGKFRFFVIVEGLP